MIFERTVSLWSSASEPVSLYWQGDCKQPKLSIFKNQPRRQQNFWAMLNKIYEWIETSFTSLRNGEPVAEHTDANRASEDGQRRRKRPIEWYER